jgi:hypothetical protein
MVVPIKTALLGMSVILVYDVLASVISLQAGLPYESFSFGSLLLYFVFGLLAFRTSSLLGSLLVGASMGFAEATLGWYLSWIIGPGRPNVQFSPFEITFAIVFVTITAAVIGLIGGSLGWLVFRKRETT